MEGPRVDRILEDWAAVASRARRPAVPPRRVVVRSGLSSGTLAGASLLVALLIGAVWFTRPDPDGGVGGAPSATPTATATPDATTPPTPTPVPTIGPCSPASLEGRILLWEGAAGHRIAHVELINTGSVACTVQAMARPQLVDGRGSVLIDGSNPPPSGVLTIASGELVTTLVQAGNYCGPAPEAPVGVVFVLGDGGRVEANPVSAGDATVPPCLGAAGSAGTIEMQPWRP
jgi:Domain of unknown function (DUF4232)